MKTETKAVVIGGGIVGVAVLYHLTKFGWKDVVLLERKQLTAGSTWHAAAGFHSLNGSPNMARLQAYTIETYKEIEEISGQDVGMHVTGAVTTACKPDTLDFVKAIWGLNQTLGIDCEMIGPEEVAKHTELLDASSVLGALYDEQDGYLDPYGATHAYAKAARMQGAEIYQQTKVEELNQREDGTWDVVTDQGTIHAEHVINAAGLWAREVGEMAGVKLPLMPYEHHYLVTENIPQLEGQEKESVTVGDIDGQIYVRQEQMGALYGVYEPNPIPWSVDGTPWDYGETDLLPSRLEDLTDTLMEGFERFPLIAEAGIKTIVNGPFTFTGDGNPLVGPVRGVDNYWVACGCMAGFSQCGAIGLTLAQWMINGEPEEDVFSMDVARFGEFATQAYTLETSKQFYERRFDVPYPNEVWPAGRPLKTTPIYDLLKDKNAVFAPLYGLEAPLWFAPEGEKAEDVPSFYRSNAFEPVGDECRAVAEGVGVFDASSFAKYEISGPGARAWLDKLLASKLPNVGRARLAVMLSEKGFIMGDLTLMQLEEGRYMLTGSGSLQEWHMRWFERMLPAEGVQLRNVSDEIMCLALVGPRARDVLQKVTRTDVSSEAFKFLAVKKMDVGMAPATVARMSLTGELGYEIYVPTLYFRSIYTTLMAAGEEFNIGDFGARALLSMRLEKGFGIWGREFSPDYTPSMNEMGHFVDYEKEDFIGREAALMDREMPAPRKLVTIEIQVENADAMGFEPIYKGDQRVGYVTSGGYGYRTEKSLAMAYLDTEHIDPDVNYEVLIIGERRQAKLLTEAAYDASGSRMRG